MGRFTNPRDLYFGEGARHEVKNLKGCLLYTSDAADD